jgi:hypothetical protein
MAKRWWGIGLVCIALFMAACGQQQATQAPAAATRRTEVTSEAATEVPSPTELVRSTLPPTWTPVLSYTPSITPTASITLTPSITPTPSLTPTVTPTVTLTYTPTPNMTNAFLLSQPLTPECADFGVDTTRTQRQFPSGTQPTVVWTPVESAVAYQIRLYDPNQTTIASETTIETEFTFDADLFELNQLYGWEVAPLDADGVQLCPARGGLLAPSP